MTAKVRSHAVAVLALLVLAACGNDQGTDGPSSISPQVGTLPADQEATIEVIWMGWEADQVDPLMQAFEEAHPNITVDYTRIPFGEIFQTLEVRLNARDATPDVYIVDGPLTPSYAARGHLLDLTEVLADDMDRFTDAAIEQGSWEGRLYSAPFVSSMALLYYNADLFEAAGIEPPAADVEQRWTWEQTLEAAKKISQLEGNPFGLVIEQSDGPYQILPLPASKGAKLISDDGLTASGYVDSPEFIEAIEFYQSLFVDHKVTPAVYDLAIGQEYFGTGQAGMMLGGTWGIQQLADDYPDLNWGVAPHPYFEGGVPATPTGSWHVGVNPRSENLEAAATFARWMTTEEAGELFFSLRPYVPVQKALFEGFLPENEAWDIIRYEVDNTAVPRPKTPGYREYEDILRRALQDIDSGADVAETLAQAAAEIDAQLEKFKE